MNYYFKCNESWYGVSLEPGDSSLFKGNFGGEHRRAIQAHWALVKKYPRTTSSNFDSVCQVMLYRPNKAIAHSGYV